MKIIYFIITTFKILILSFAWFGTERQENEADIIVIPEGLKLDYDPTLPPPENNINS